MFRSKLPQRQTSVKLDVSLAIVNIVLLLIFFFLATGSLLNAPSFNIELAETEELPIDILPQPLLIVEDDGGLRFNGNLMADELLGAALEDTPLLHVLIDREAPAIDLLNLLSRPAFDGIEILLVTIHKRAEGS